MIFRKLIKFSRSQREGNENVTNVYLHVRLSLVKFDKNIFVTFKLSRD